MVCSPLGVKLHYPSSLRHLTLSQSDMAALTGGKGFPFLFQHIRDGINIRQTCNLIFSLCRYNNRLAEHVGFSP